jgi:hypothetical protein
MIVRQADTSLDGKQHHLLLYHVMAKHIYQNSLPRRASFRETLIATALTSWL